MFRITVILVSVYTEREPLGLTACLVVIKIYSKNQMSFTYQIDIYIITFIRMHSRPRSFPSEWIKILNDKDMN